MITTTNKSRAAHEATSSTVLFFESHSAHSLHIYARSPLVTGTSFFHFREDMAECAVDWAHGYDLIDAVSLSSFVFQPAVLLKLILFWIYWAALIEGVKVYYAARGWAGELEWKEFICFGSDNGYDYKFDHFLVHRFNTLKSLPLFYHGYICADCVAF